MGITFGSMLKNKAYHYHYYHNTALRIGRYM